MKNAWNSLQLNLEKHAIKKQNIYIMPTKDGFLYTGIMFAIFLIGLSYGNNLTLATAFILFTYFLMEMLTTHNNIQKLKIHSLIVNDEHANKTTKIELILHENNPIHAIGLRSSLGDYSLENHELSLIANISLKRGKYLIENPRLYHTGHTGLFYAWKYILVNKTLYIYPAPKIQKELHYQQHQSQKFSTDEEDFHSHLPYQPGMSSKRIDWKAFAKTDSLYFKKFSSPFKSEILINYHDYPGPLEERLSYMTFTLQEAYKNGQVWSLVLPKQSKWRASTYQDYLSCLRLLAEVIA